MFKCFKICFNVMVYIGQLTLYVVWVAEVSILAVIIVIISNYCDNNETEDWRSSFCGFYYVTVRGNYIVYMQIVCNGAIQKHVLNYLIFI